MAQEVSPGLRQLKPGTVLTRFVVDKVVLGQGFLPGSTVFPVNFHYIVALDIRI
jgi:hypothetical protein